MSDDRILLDLRVGSIGEPTSQALPAVVPRFFPRFFRYKAKLSEPRYVCARADSHYFCSDISLYIRDISGRLLVLCMAVIRLLTSQHY